MVVDKNKALSDSLELLRQSKWHRDYMVEDIFRYIIAPIKHDKLRLYYANEKPIGLITWCWLDKEAGENFLTFNYHISEEDYNQDTKEELWGIEFVAPYGHARQIMKLNREEYKATYPDRNEKVHWRRLSDPTKRHTKKV